MLINFEKAMQALTRSRMKSGERRAFKQSQSFLRGILDALSAHIAILDTSGIIVTVNVAWREFAQANGLTSAHWGVGTNYLEVCERAQGIDREEAVIASQGIRDVLAKRRKCFYLEYPCHSVDEQRWFALRTTPFQTKHQRWVVVAHENITERKQAEQQVAAQQTQLMHAARLSMLGEMTAGIAHEINQPLTAIYSYAKACIQSVRSGASDPETLIDTLEKISSAAHQGGKVIHNLRAMVKRNTNQPREIEICSLIRDVAKLIKLDSRPQNFRLKLKLPSQLPPVSADTMQLQQVVLNLIRNAIDANEDAPDEDKAVTLSANMAHKNYIEVTVKDCGRGLSDRVAKQLYEPFFTTKDSGMGMGLTVAQSIITAYDGQLWFSKNRHRGTTFHFTLPIALG